MENSTFDVDAIYKTMPTHYGFTFTNTFHHKSKAGADPSKVSLPDGFTVVVTGASYGIGEHIAKAYAHAKATTIVIVSRTASEWKGVKKELRDIGTSYRSDIKVFIHAGDVLKPETSQQIKALLEAECGGRLDCLVCNAGAGVSGNGV